MRAISLWQPWATAVAIGSKTIETRHWATDYRGPLVIHAAKRCVMHEMLYYACCWNWCAAMAPAGWRMGKSTDELLATMPFGALVGVVDLVDCRPAESFTLGELEEWRYAGPRDSDCYRWNERQMGNFEAGRFGWVLANPRALRLPITYTGRQAFFNVPDALVA